jgi:hypothetical protein
MKTREIVGLLIAIAGLIILLIGSIFGLIGFVYSLIYGVPAIIIGILIALNKKEDKIEQVNYKGVRKNVRK